MSKLPFPAPKLPSLPPMLKVSVKEVLDFIAMSTVLLTVLGILGGILWFLWCEVSPWSLLVVSLITLIAWAFDRVS